MVLRGLLFLSLLYYESSFALQQPISRQRHHQRRSINYDNRWFGFHFNEQPQGGVFSDGSIHLKCTFNLSRRRETIVEWKKDGAALTNSDKRVERQDNGSLVIRDATTADGGIYQCLIHVSDPADASSWTFLSRKALVRLPLPLRLLEQPVDVSVQRGQPAAFRCSLEEVDKVSLRWFKDGRSLTPSDEYRIIPLSSTLEISSVEAKHVGSYRCIAERGVSRVESNPARLTIALGGEESEIHLLLSPASQRVTAGDTIILECLIVGSRPVKAEWRKDGQPLKEEGRIQRVGVSSILLTAVMVEDDGSYSCGGRDGDEAVERTAVLSVNSPPHITSPPADRIVQESSDVELECFSAGRPTPTIAWFKNGEALIASEYFVIDANRLRILGVVKADQGVYQCLAENSAGVTQAAAQLLVDSSDSSSVAGSSGEPLLASSPLGVRLLSVGSREASVAWDPPLQRHGTLLRYHVYYREEGSQRERVLSGVETSRAVRELQAGTAYEVRVAAENEAGIGALSQPLRLHTTKEQAVPGQVRELRASPLGAETISVEWKAPISSGAPPLRYRLFYARSDAKDTDRETQINVPSTAYTMHGMDKYTEYTIRVEAEGDNGPGLSSDTIKVRTMSDVPASAPLDISAEALSSTSIRVSWLPPEDSLTNGPITGYRLKYKTKARGSKGNTVSIEPSSVSYTLSGLDPKTAYTLRMAIVNQNGTGPYSDWIGAETALVDKEESLLGAPRELRPVPGTDFIQLYWRPPADESILVRGYQIGWGQNVPDVESVRVESNVVQHKIIGLKPGRDYVVSLRAFNRQGSGFPIYETVRTSQQSDEVDGLEGGMAVSDGDSIQAPMGVRAIALSPTSIRVSWADASTGFNTLYTVKYTSSSDGNALRFTNSSEQWAVVENLRPATEYELAVRAFQRPSTLSPWSMAVRNRTLPAPPSSAPRDLTILPAASGDPASVTVNWQPPKYANGEILEYILFYSDRPSAREDEWNQLVIPGERLSHPIHSLLPKANYYFKMQAKNIKGFGPMSSVQSYSPGSAGFVHPVHVSNPRPAASIFGTDLIELAKSNPLYLLVGGAILLLLGLCVLLLSVWFCKRPAKPKPRGGAAGYTAGRKGSSQQRTDLWIQHGGGSQMMAPEAIGASLNDMKHVSESPPPRYQSSLQNREEPVYGSVLPSRVVARRTPVRASLSSYDDGSSSQPDSYRPLIGRTKPMPSSSAPPPPVPPANYAMSEDGGGTLSRSYHHSSSSLEAARQRTPHVVYSGHPRHHAKVELGDSPYGSSIGLGSGTPPPPSLAPPQPPHVTSDGYRTLRGTGGGVNSLRSFSQMAPTASPQLRMASSSSRQVPVGRAAAQPRVNVANLCSGYIGSSMSMEDEKQRQREDERDSEHTPLQSAMSTEEVTEGITTENIDYMISDLQKVQQQFGLSS